MTYCAVVFMCKNQLVSHFDTALRRCVRLILTFLSPGANGAQPCAHYRIASAQRCFKLLEIRAPFAKKQKKNLPRFAFNHVQSALLFRCALLL